MASSMRFIFGLVAGMAGSAAICLASQAMAQETAAQRAYKARSWMALDRCAVYGPDFATVEGTQTCAKIGGHVRVELGAPTLHASPNDGWGTAPAAMRSEGVLNDEPTDLPSGRHLRLRQDSAPTYDGSYLR